MIYLVNVSKDLKGYLTKEGIAYTEVKGLDKEIEGFQVVEKESLNQHLISQLFLYRNGKLEHKISKKIKVDKENEAIIGGQHIDDLSPYMLKIMHPKYKAYMLLKDYLTNQGELK